MENGYVDLDIRCRDCDRVFVLTAGEAGVLRAEGPQAPEALQALSPGEADKSTAAGHQPDAAVGSVPIELANQWPQS